VTNIPEIWAIDLQSEQTEFLADCPWLTEVAALTAERDELRSRIATGARPYPEIGEVQK